MELSTEVLERIKIRLATIKTKAKNKNGYYVLEEKHYFSIYCRGDKAYALELYLKHFPRVYYGIYSTYYNKEKHTKEYGYCFEIKKTYKKTLERVNEYLNNKSVLEQWENFTEVKKNVGCKGVKSNAKIFSSQKE